jgi:DNA-binding CsgD family transcriptional regulator
MSTPNVRLLHRQMTLAEQVARRRHDREWAGASNERRRAWTEDVDHTLRLAFAAVGAVVAAPVAMPRPPEVMRPGPKVHPSVVEKLTARQVELLTHLIEYDLPDEVIAVRMGIGPETVKTHLARARVKLGASSRTQLAIIALVGVRE